MNFTEKRSCGVIFKVSVDHILDTLLYSSFKHQTCNAHSLLMQLTVVLVSKLEVQDTWKNSHSNLRVFGILKFSRHHQSQFTAASQNPLVVGFHQTVFIIHCIAKGFLEHILEISILQKVVSK